MRTTGILPVCIGWGLLLLSCQKDRSCETCLQDNGAANRAPQVHAGPDQFTTLPKDSVVLDGSASTDPDGSIVRYQWRKIAGPASHVFRRGDMPRTPVSVLAEGIYAFELEATDDKGARGRDTVQVTVLKGGSTNQPPVAHAGADQVLTLPANSMLLDGSLSSDPENNIAGYAWTKVAGPSQFRIQNAAAAQTVAEGLVEGVYQFELKVTDSERLSSSDTVQITVAPAAAPALIDTVFRDLLWNYWHPLPDSLFDEIYLVLPLPDDVIGRVNVPGIQVFVQLASGTGWEEAVNITNGLCRTTYFFFFSQPGLFVQQCRNNYSLIGTKASVRIVVR